MTTQPDFDTMTDAELANYHYTHRDNPLGDEADLEEIKIEIAHPLSVRNESNAAAQPLTPDVQQAEVPAAWSSGVDQVNP